MQRKPHTVVGDLETRSFSDLRREGSHKYSCDPSTQVLCLSYKIDSSPTELWHRGHPALRIPQSMSPERLIEVLEEPDTIFVAHNAKFEKDNWENALRREFPWFPPLDPDRVRCTAAKAATHNLPRGLDAAASIMGVGSKDKAGHDIMLQLCRPESPKERLQRLRHEPGSNSRMEPVAYPGCESRIARLFDEYRSMIEALKGRYKNPNIPEDDLTAWYWPGTVEMHQANWKYCVQDTDVEHRLDLRLNDIPARQIRWYMLDQSINSRGVTIDKRGVQGAIKIADEAERRAGGRLAELTGGAVTKVTQSARIKDYLVEHLGQNLENMQRDYLERALVHSEITDPRAEEIIRTKLDATRSTPKKFKAMLKGLGDDNRLRDIIVYEGSATGRWSGINAQLLNLFRGQPGEMEIVWEAIASGDIDWLEALYEKPAMTVLTEAARGAIVATPGRHFADVDYKTIQVRIALWLAGEFETLRLMSEGHDVYRIMAAEDIYHVPLDLVSTLQRQIAKSAFLGCQFGLGAPGFILYCLKFGVELRFPEALQAVQGYRSRFPGVVQQWQEMTELSKRAVARPGHVFELSNKKIKFKCGNRFLFMRLPSGRIIHYPDPQIRESRKFPGQTELSYRGFGGSRVGTWGGGMFADAVQGLEVDIVAPGIDRAATALPIDPVLIVHDEGLFEVKDVEIEEIVHHMRDFPEPWTQGLPIECEFWTGDRYRWK